MDITRNTQTMFNIVRMTVKKKMRDTKCHRATGLVLRLHTDRQVTLSRLARISMHNNNHLTISRKAVSMVVDTLSILIIQQLRLLISMDIMDSQPCNQVQVGRQTQLLKQEEVYIKSIVTLIIN